MNLTLIFAIITITLALIFYTIGVWSEHRSKKLKKLHLLFFWLVPYILGMIIGMS